MISSKNSCHTLKDYQVETRHNVEDAQQQFIVVMGFTKLQR
ncbi:7122_t:CDS:2 [Funneliformis caledonium]|uniref:7122_t:CDS:1 n=1 Tax=Funneliformis caledonium TaxID=1117310 RepID=A0A9N9GEQ0_9GLOM|nr:7122_t:CDS:2 [Funneliformis caledonium]